MGRCGRDTASVEEWGRYQYLPRYWVGQLLLLPADQFTLSLIWNLIPGSLGYWEEREGATGK